MTLIAFEKAAQNKQSINLDYGLEIAYIGLRDFIANKQASGRIKDLTDIKPRFCSRPIR